MYTLKGEKIEGGKLTLYAHPTNKAPSRFSKDRHNRVILRNQITQLDQNETFKDH